VMPLLLPSFSVDILLTCFLLTPPEDQLSDIFAKPFKSMLETSASWSTVHFASSKTLTQSLVLDSTPTSPSSLKEWPDKPDWIVLQ
jgi:hypothetical protein